MGSNSASATSSAAPDEALQDFVLPVQGMTCAACVAHVEKALGTVPGVRAARVNLATESASVAASTIDATRLRSAIEAAGYEVPTERTLLDVEGMTCASFAANSPVAGPTAPSRYRCRRVPRIAWALSYRMVTRAPNIKRHRGFRP